MRAGPLSSLETDFMGTQCDVACYGDEKPEVKCLGRFRERCVRTSAPAKSVQSQDMPDLRHGPGRLSTPTDEARTMPVGTWMS